MDMKVVSMKGGFPPPIGVVLTESLARVQSRARKLAEDTVKFVRTITPSRTGYMRATARYWSFRVYGRGGFVFWFGWRKSDYGGKRAFYPIYVNWGTGVYGLYGRPIFPLSAPRLAWEFRGGWVSAWFVSGQRPQRILARGQRFAQEKLRDIYQYEVAMGMRKRFG